MRPADHLGQYDRPGEEAREADLGQEGGEARHREHGDFELGVRDEHDAEGGTQDERTVGGEVIIDHGSVSWTGTGSKPENLILSPVQCNRLISNLDIATMQSKPRGDWPQPAYLWSTTGAPAAP